MFCIFALISYLNKPEKRQFSGKTSLPSHETQASLKIRLSLPSGKEIVIAAERAADVPASGPRKTPLSQFKYNPRPQLRQPNRNTRCNFDANAPRPAPSSAPSMGLFPRDKCRTRVGMGAYNGPRSARMGSRLIRILHFFLFPNLPTAQSCHMYCMIDCRFATTDSPLYMDGRSK